MKQKLTRVLSLVVRILQRGPRRKGRGSWHVRHEGKGESHLLCPASVHELIRILSQGKAKYKAWKEVNEKNLSAEAAQKHYVELVEELKNTLGYEG